MEVKYRIHPAIGIARIGNSREEHFIGPEAPGIVPVANGSFKSTNGFIKRQAVRYRVYQYKYDDFGALVDIAEVSPDDAIIEWHVHLVNRKGEAPKFPGGPGLRNAQISKRSDLVIDPGVQVISGNNQSIHLAGSFLSTEVELGDLLTDESGRLLVLGGFGSSRSVPAGQAINHFANNDGWCDDTADGPVMANVRVNGDDVVAAEPAWIIVAPPDFAPPIENVVTLYDIVFQAAIELDPTLVTSSNERVSFTRDIYPILKRVRNLRWVSKWARKGHGEFGFDFLSDEFLPNLQSNEDSARSSREKTFNRLRSPFSEDQQDRNEQNMPFLGYERGMAVEPLELTAFQYEKMRVWSRGDFDADWTGDEIIPVEFDQIPEHERPSALDRAALEACVGGPFFPGIEAANILAKRETYEAPFRISRDWLPGSVTAGLAVPWQADFELCSHLWWPGQRPNSVLRDGEWANWVPERPEGPVDTNSFRMVRDWFRLGFIAKSGSGFVETERNVDED